MNKNLPDHIRAKVIDVFGQGMSEEEIAKLIGESVDTISEIIRDLGLPENRNTLLDHIVLNLHKDGSDVKEFEDFTKPKKVLVQQGVSPSDSLELAINIAEFCCNTRLSPKALVRIYSHYLKAASWQIKTFKDLRTKALTMADPSISFEQDEIALEAKYTSLVNELNE